MYFINGCYWEKDPTSVTLERVIFHGLINNEDEGSRNGNILDEADILSFVTGWNWNQEEKTLKFLATYSDDLKFPVFYHLVEITPFHFEGMWEVQGGVKQKVRLIITMASDEFFNHDTKPDLTA